MNKHLPPDRRVHPSTPFSWRDRGTIPREPLPSVIAGVLTEVHGEAVTVERLWPGRTTATETAVRPATADVTAGQWIPADTTRLLRNHGQTPAGRTFFPVSGSDLISITRSWMSNSHSLAADNGPLIESTRISTELVDYFEQDAASLRRLDDGDSSGHQLRRAVELRLAHIAEILDGCSHTTALARRLFAVASQLAQMAGWTAFDSGEHGLAQRMYLLALRAAVAADDRALGALVLSCIAQQQTWRGRPRDAISIMSALDTARHPMLPRAQSLLLMRQARSFAASGMHIETMSSLQRAYEALDTPSREPEPPWGYWMNRAVLDSEAGRCHLMLGDRRLAEAHLSDGLAQVAADATRDRVMYGLSLALTHLPSNHRPGDVEQACYQTEQVLPLLPSIGSARCHSLLNTVLSHLRPYHKTAAVRELMDKVESQQQPQVC
nr:hypothetical protein [Nocardia miyunensis]